MSSVISTVTSPHAPRSVVPQAAASPAAVAKRFEKAFVSEMLKQADIGLKSGDPAVDDAFGGFGRDAFAEAVTAQGGVGLAPIIEAYLKNHNASGEPSHDLARTIQPTVSGNERAAGAGIRGIAGPSPR